jgi:hypothetical protein
MPTENGPNSDSKNRPKKRRNNQVINSVEMTSLKWSALLSFIPMTYIMDTSNPYHINPTSLGSMITNYCPTRRHR